MGSAEDGGTKTWSKGLRGRRQKARRPRPSMVPGEQGQNAAMTLGGKPGDAPFYQYLTSSEFDESQRQVVPTDIWRGLKEQTTAHGIPHIAHARGPVKKAFWSIMTAITVGALLFNLYAITKSFFSYKVDVTIKLRHKNELTFPAVTVCNMSPVKKSIVENPSKRRRKRAVSACEVGWSEHVDNCYWASDVTGSYNTSVTSCQTKGGQLASVRDDAEYIFIKSISVDIGTDEYWFDLVKDSATSTWRWSDGSDATFVDWASDAPSTTGPCARLTDTGYRDQDCSDSHKFICVKGATTDQTTTQSTTSAVEGNCCCTCCFSVSDASSTDTCGSCVGPNPSNAAHCAATVVPTAPPTTTTPAPPTTTTLEPQPIPGSLYPERVQTREDFQQEEKLTETLANIEESEKVAMGFTSSDLILDCQYSGYTCHVSEFYSFYNPILGNCYIFNSGWDNASLPLKKSLKAGRRHGLHMILNIDQSEYVKEVGDTAGLRMVVHPQERMPFPEDEGITVSPGHATSVGIKQVELERKSRPYSNCINPDTDQTAINIYQELHPATTYSTNACQRTCYQRHVITECGCGDPKSPMKGKALNAGNATIKACDSTNITQDDCKYFIEQLFINNSLECNCPDSCGDTAYSVEVSLGEWPSNVQKESLLEKLSPKIGDSFDITDPYEYKENLIKVEVYYEEFNYEQIVERPSYPVVDLCPKMAAKIKSLQLWCKRQCEGYRDVEITNMTSSWKSGLAFCAIIHRYRPDLIDYDSLSKENVYENNKLAFDVGQDLDIPALLDPEDMVTMTVPDKLCIVTYVSQYYKAFGTKEPAGGPGIKQYRTPAKRNCTGSSSAPDAKKITPTKDHNGHIMQSSQNGHQNAAAARKGTFGDTCQICGRKVYLMERHIDEGKLYHRRCIRDKQKSLRSPTRSQHAPSAFEWPSNSSSSSNNMRSNARVTESSKENKPVAHQLKSTHVSVPATQTNSISSDITNSSTHTSRVSSHDVLGTRSMGNVPEKSKSASLVKMLYGAPAPYGGSTAAESNTAKSSSERNSEQTISSNNKRPVPSERGAGSANGRKPNNRPSISQRAALFNNGPAPGEQKAISHGVRGPTSATAASYVQNKPRDVDVVSYTYHTGVVSTTTHPAASQGPEPVSIRSGLLSNLANIRRQENKPGISSKSTAKARLGSDDKSQETQPSPSFLGDESALNNDHSNMNSNVNSSSKTTAEMPSVISSILKARASEGHSSQSADLHGHKSILKSSSPRQSFDAASFKETTPRTILKPRFNESSDKSGAEDQPMTILKPRRKSDELETAFGSPSNPRSILKSGQSPDSGRSRSTSPPKSILKSRESSPETVHKPISILKSKDSVEDMDVDDVPWTSDSKPRSILKHVHGDSPGTRDEQVTSPSRSILKHTPHDHNESKSILKSGGTDQQNGQADSEASRTEHADPILSDTSRPSSQTFVPSPRAQIKIPNKPSVPQPAPRHLGDKNKAKSASTEKFTSKFPSPSKDTSAHPYNREKTGSPKSILKTTHEISPPHSGPEISKSSWGRGIPQAGKSSGIPSVSSSLSKPRPFSTGSPPAAVGNNFSAFNLNDSMMIHGNINKTETDVSKGKSSPPKPAWQLEMEARKGVQPKDAKNKAPPRPMEPPAQSKRLSLGPSRNPGSDAGKPDWQLEAEKRNMARKGKYEDPEFRRVNAAKNKSAELRIGASAKVAVSSASDKSSGFAKIHQTVKPGDDKPVSPPARPTQPPHRSAPPPPLQITSHVNSPPPTQSTPPIPSPRPSYSQPTPPPQPSESVPPLPKSPPPPTTSVQSSDSQSPPVPQRRPIKHQYEMIVEIPSSLDSDASSRKGNLNRTPAFRIADSPESSPNSSNSKDNSYSTSEHDTPERRRISLNNTDNNNSPEVNYNRRKILPDDDFTFKSGDFEFDLNSHKMALTSHRPASSNVLPPGGDWIQRRPLPTPPGFDDSPPRRKVNAEQRVATLRIVRDLEDIEKRLRSLEEEGRAVEDKIRSVSEDDMDEDVLMAQWFEMVSNKNDLVRRESELMYRQRQQELEDVHTDLEHELRLLMLKPDERKTASERVRETTLIQELLETVNQRNSIVDSMEEDRKRYIAEDQEIADMMAKTGLTGNEAVGGKKKKKPDKKKQQKKTGGRGPKDNLNHAEKGVSKDRKLFRLSIG